MKHITSAQLSSWQDQCRDEALRWHKARMPGLSDLQTAAFHAGFDQGWRSLRSALIQHGHLKVGPSLPPRVPARPHAARK